MLLYDEYHYYMSVLLTVCPNFALEAGEIRLWRSKVRSYMISVPNASWLASRSAFCKLVRAYYFHLCISHGLWGIPVLINVTQGHTQRVNQWGVRRRRRRLKGELEKCVATPWLRVMPASKSIYIPAKCRSTTPTKEFYLCHTQNPESTSFSPPLFFRSNFGLFFFISTQLFLFLPHFKKIPIICHDSHQIWFTRLMNHWSLPGFRKMWLKQHLTFAI